MLQILKISGLLSREDILGERSSLSEFEKPT